MSEVTEKYTRALADYAVGLKFEDIPADIVDHVKRVTLNQIGAALSGWQVEPGQEVVAVLAALGGREEATVLGRPLRLPAPPAAAINATLAWAPMNDDTHVEALLHSGHGSVHPALAEGEARGASGRAVIEAVVAANEVGIRIARSVSPAHDQAHSSSRLGFWSELRTPFCAAVASAKLLGLDSARMGHAIGIAATSTSGLQDLGESSPEAGTVYAWEAGKGVLGGMLAARLAEQGMTDGPAPLEGRLGWVRLYTWGHGRPEWLTEGLGTRFETGRIQIKSRCNSSMVHPIIDATHALVHEHGLSGDSIARLTVKGQEWLRQYLWRPQARSFQDAIFSLPFSLALVILEPGAMTYPDQVVRRLGDPEMAALMARMRMEVDPDLTFGAEMAGAVVIDTRDGRTLGKVAEVGVRGAYPEHPFAPGELEAKFRRLGRDVLSQDRLDAIVAKVAALDELVDVGELAALLRPED